MKIYIIMLGAWLGLTSVAIAASDSDTVAPLQHGKTVAKTNRAAHCNNPSAKLQRECTHDIAAYRH